MELLEAKLKLEFGLMCLLGHAAPAYTLVTPEAWTEACVAGESAHVEPPPAVCFWCKRVALSQQVLTTLTDMELYDTVTRIQHFERLRAGYPKHEPEPEYKPGSIIQMPSCCQSDEPTQQPE